MKCILIPVDFSVITQNVLSYTAGLCKETSVENVILFKNFHVPLITQILPDANMLEITNEDIIEEKQLITKKLQELGDALSASLSPETQVICCLTEGKWFTAVENVIQKYKPDLVILGSDPKAENNDSIIAERIVPFAKSSLASVLVVPKDAVYQKLKRVLVPTSFENLERLRLMEELCITQAWLNAEILVLHVDPAGKYKEDQKEHTAVLDRYLKNYNYQLTYSSAKNIVDSILNFARTNEVQLIMALPGKHSFLYGFIRKSVTESFALNSNNVVLLLK